MSSSVLDQAKGEAVAAGLNLLGLVDRRRFDASERVERRFPESYARCGTIVVLGTGGRAVDQAYRRWRNEKRRPDRASLAAFVIAGIERVAAALRRDAPSSLLWCGGACPVNDARLGEAAGFGIVSPVSGMLLHPLFGPWVRVRAAVLMDGHPFGEIVDASLADSFLPCCGCARPCVTNCPASIHDGAGHYDLVRCGTHRLGGGCESGCGSRGACPVGSEHRDDGEDLHRHTYELASVRRWLGFGLWRVVPPSWRGGPWRDS